MVWNRLSDIVPRDSYRVMYGEGDGLKTRDNVWISLMDSPDEAVSSLLLHSVIY